MIIGIDGNEANIKNRVGVGQFAFNILTQLANQKSNHHYFIYLKSQPLADLPPEAANWHYVVFGPQKMWTKFALPLHLYLSKQKLDVFYSPSHYSPHFCPFPTVPTIHDLGYLDTPEQFTKKDFYQLSDWTKHSIQRASRIVAVSEFTKNEIVRIYNISPNKIDVVYNGIGSLPQASSNTLQKFNISKPYFLYLGTLKPNKNIPFLINAYSQLKTKSQLVIAGKKGWLFDDIFKLVKKLKLENKIIFTDFISESEKYTLYQNATATILPSLYEGFGIPAIEAQQAGSPIIVSKIPPYIETITQDSAIFIDINTTTDLVNAMQNIIKPSLREKLIKYGQKNYQRFSWSNSAEALLKSLNKI